MAAYDIKWEAPRIILPEDIPAFLAKYPAEETACCRHNALFDLSILSWRYGWVPAVLWTLWAWRGHCGPTSVTAWATSPRNCSAPIPRAISHKVKGLDAVGIKRAGLWPDFQTYALQDVRLCYLIYMRLITEFPGQRSARSWIWCCVRPLSRYCMPISRCCEQHLGELRKRKATAIARVRYDKAALMSTAQFKKAWKISGVEVEMKTIAHRQVDSAVQQDRPVHERTARLRTSRRMTISITRSRHWPRRGYRRDRQSRRHGPRGSSISPSCRGPMGRHAAGCAALWRCTHHRLSGEWKLNLQNLPRDKSRSKLREAFVAPAGHKMVTADLAQIEARIVACYVGK